jgi:AraC-like DNA-binding protein
MDKTSIEKMLAALARGRMRCFGPPGAGSAHGAASCKRPRKGRAFYRPQFHAYPEIIFGVEGRLEVFINGRWARWQPGKVWVFLPGAVHSERHVHGRPYRMFWMVVTPQVIGFHITAYKPHRGYHLVGKRLALQHSLRAPLLELACRPELGRDKLMQIHFQSLLMNALYQVIPYMDKRSKGSKPAAVPYHHQVAEQVKAYLDAHYPSDVALSELAGMVHYSPCHLNLLFRRQTGVPIRQYLLRRRMERAETLLRTARMEIKQVAYSTGFKDPLYFSRLFRRWKGASAREYRRSCLLRDG